MANRSIVTTLRAEIGQFKAAMKDAASSTEQVGTASEKAASKGGSAFDRLAKSASENKQAWTTVGTSMAVVGGSILAVGAAALKTGIAYNTLQQTSRAALKTLLGSAKAASAQMDKLDVFARTSPFAKSVFITAQQQLLGFGIAAKNVIPTLDAIQNAVAAIGGSDADIAGIALTLAKVKGEGKITADTLNELGVRGVDAATLIGSQMGMTGAEIRESITKGAIGADQALAALTKGMQAKFGGAAANVKSTFAGSLDRVKAAWRDLSSELAKPLVGPNGGGLAVGGLNKLADTMRSFQSLPGPVKVATIATVGLGAAATVAGGAFLTLIPRIVATRAALATMGPGANRAAGALGALAASVSALIIAAAGAKTIGNLIDNQQYATVNQYSNALRGLGTNVTDAGKKLDALASTKVMGSWIDKLNDPFKQNKLEKNITGVADAIKTLDLNPLEKITNTLAGFARETAPDAAAKSINTIDEALANLVSSGDVAGAATGFKYFEEQAAKSGKTVDQARKMLPKYSDALVGISGDQKATAKTAEKLGLAVGATAAETKAAAEAYAKLKQGTVDVALSFLDFSKGLDKNNLSFGKWIQGLDEMAKAQRNWQSNMIKASSMGATDETIAKFQELGPAGAKMLQQMVDGGKVSVAELNKILSGAGDSADNFSNRLHDALGKIPPKVRTAFVATGDKDAIGKAAAVAHKYHLATGDVIAILKANDWASKDIAAVLKRLKSLNATTAKPKIAVNANAALSQIGKVQAAINAMYGKSVGVVPHYLAAPKDKPYTGMKLPAGYAGGGIVPGKPPADPRVDNVFARGASTGRPLLVRSGEWIVNQPASKKNDHWLRAINGGLDMDAYMSGFGVPHFAGGGRANGGIAGQSPTDKLTIYSTPVGKSLKAESDALKKTLADTKKSFDSFKSKLDEARTAMQSYAEDVASKFKTDPFNQGNAGLDGNPFSSGLAAFGATVAEDTQKATDMRAALKRLKGKGLNGLLFKDLAASGDVLMAQDLASQSKATVDYYEKAYKARDIAATSVGSYAGQAVFGKEIAKLTATVANLHKQIQRVTLEERDVKSLAHQIGGAVSSNLKSTAGSSQHSSSNKPRG